jgi:hypothetical protein
MGITGDKVMSKYLLSAAAAAFLLVGGNVVVGSQEAQAACSLPGGDNTQWTCELDQSVQVQNVIIRISAAQGGQCKTGTIETTTTTEVAVNPGGSQPGTDNFDGDSSVAVTDVDTSGSAFACPTDGTPLYDKDGNPL